MKLMKFRVFAPIAFFCFVGCMEDDISLAGAEGAFNGLIESSSSFFLPVESNGSFIMPIESSGATIIVGFSSSTDLPIGVNTPYSSDVGIIPNSSSSVIFNPIESSNTNPIQNPIDGNEPDLGDTSAFTHSETLLNLSGITATVENNNGCITLEDKSATITCPGDYYVSGESSDFQIVVNTPGIKDEGNTHIYLNNVTLKSPNSPILVKNADKTVIHLVTGSVNVVEDGNGNHLFQKNNGTQDTAKAAIYSKDDLNIKGDGKLTVNGNFKNGIQSSNDLKIKNGDITVVAKDNGIKGKGSIEISGGILNITSKEGDGLESDECVEANDSCTSFIENKGIVLISGGNITVKAHDDGVTAANFILVSDSVEASLINITSTGKGFSAERIIYVNGGTININSKDDAMHTHARIYMNAGSVTISSEDDGIHADSTLYLRGSTINITTAYEGMESYKIIAEGGVSSTYATNDGWNAAGGAKENNGGFSSFSESSGHVEISGGYHYISSKGNMIDVLDANGFAKQSGGVLILEITGQSYENGGGGFGGGFGGWGGFGGGGNSNGCASNMAGGLIDTDAGFEITGGVLLAFGNYSTDTPKCESVNYTNANFYGSNVAAFKPQYQGSTIFYGGDVQSVSQVNVTGMNEFKFPNGLVYMYK